MRNYKKLSLIGCVLGIGLMLGVWISINVIMGTFKSGNLTELITNYEIQSSQGNTAFLLANTFISTGIYIICLVVTFVVETKNIALGTTLIILGITPIAIGNILGIIPFGLLLAAGILVLTPKFASKCTCGNDNPIGSKFCNICARELSQLN